MTEPLRFNFVRSATRVEDLPPAVAEVAFLGRSNVGKSSLLNALANRKRLAHVSKTPGRTQLLNLFSLGADATAVDLPGYGYAAVPGRTRGDWQPMIEGYLLGRVGLVRLLVLVDGEIGPTPLDVQLLEWLRHHGRPVTIVASKQDKVKPSKRVARRRDLAHGCGVPAEDVAWVSASSGEGIEELRRSILGWLEEGRGRAAAGGTNAGPEAPENRGRGSTRRNQGGGGPRRKVVEPVVQNPDGTWPDEDEWN